MRSEFVRYRLNRVIIGCLVSLLIQVMSAAAHHDSRHGDHAGSTLSMPELLTLYECARCHRLNTPHRLVGPSLWKIHERADADAIRASILSPDAVVKTGFPTGKMQKRLQEIGFYQDIVRNPDILERIVAYLMQTDAPLPTQTQTQTQAGAEVAHDGMTSVRMARWSGQMGSGLIFVGSRLIPRRLPGGNLPRLSRMAAIRQSGSGIGVVGRDLSAAAIAQSRGDGMRPRTQAPRSRW